MKSETIIRKVEKDGVDVVVHTKITNIGGAYVVDWGIGAELVEAACQYDIILGRDIEWRELMPDVEIVEDPNIDDPEEGDDPPKRYNIHVVIEVYEVASEEYYAPE